MHGKKADFYRTVTFWYGVVHPQASYRFHRGIVKQNRLW